MKASSATTKPKARPAKRLSSATALSKRNKSAGSKLERTNHILILVAILALVGFFVMYAIRMHDMNTTVGPMSEIESSQLEENKSQL